MTDYITPKLLNRPKRIHQAITEIIGLQFGDLTVIEFCPRVISGKKTRAFNCLCKCGNSVNALLGNLRKGTNNCGCGSKRKLPNGHGARNRMIIMYKKNASKRGLEYSLTNEQIIALFEGNCFYCGLEPSNICNIKGGNGPYIYSGIDRVDNDLGYTPDNCVSCCRECNFAKRGFTKNQFIALASRITNHQLRQRRIHETTL